MEKSLMTSKLRSVISLVDKLRDIQLEEYIKLPKIVAVGSQSSGKSSLVEQIVGLDFLPRGSGVVTRRPLQIRMVYQKDLKQPFGKFAELPDQKFTDFSKIKDSIEALTDKVCGTNKNIVDKPIILDVYSANCPNLTIIDLPGLTRIAIDGQDKDIHKITTNMIKKYMQEPSTIILCVIPANQDITNDQALYLARSIDPNGVRTIGCITKIDIMDRGTDARQTLLNKGEVQLKLGFVGIKNRSQADINQKKTVQESIEAQKMYFSKSPIYSSLPLSAMGTTSLVSTLTQVLTESIIQFLPDLVAKIKERKAKLADIVKQFGRPLPKTPMQKQALIWSMCNLFLNEYRKCISGQIGSLRCSQELMKSSADFSQNLSQALEEETNYKPADNLSDEKIMVALKRYDTSENLVGFPSIYAFLLLLDPLIKKLKSPLEETLNSVHDSLLRISDLIISEVAHEYLQFREHINDVIGSILRQFKKKSMDYLEAVMESERGYVYTNNPVFDSYLDTPTPKSELTVYAKQNPMILVLRKRVDSYYRVVVQALRDLIPKNIKYLLLHQATKKIQFQLFQNAAQGGEVVDRYLKIGEASKSERMKREQQYDIICKAEQYLLTHSGLATLRQGQAKKRLVFRQKQLEEAEKKRKIREQQKKQASKQRNLEERPIEAEKAANTPSKANTTQSKPKDKDKDKEDINKADEQKSKQSFFNNFFGTNKPAPKPQQVKNEPQKPAVVEPVKNKTSFGEIFGTEPKKKTQSTMPVIKQEGTNKKGDYKDVYNREVGKASDNAVDSMYANQKFQQKSKEAVSNGSSLAAQKKLGVSEETGNSIGKGAAWLFGQDATQNYLKQETKKNIRSQTMVPGKK